MHCLDVYRNTTMVSGHIVYKCIFVFNIHEETMKTIESRSYSYYFSVIKLDKMKMMCSFRIALGPWG